jgi:CheY-like chemotaxis protein/SAM-dependent methyltransferase
LDLTKDIQVVGEAENGNTALPLIRECAPDVVIMDIEMPGLDGIALTEILCAENTPAAIVILTMHDDAETRARARAAGASKFVSKHEGATALLEAIRQVALNVQAATITEQSDSTRKPLASPQSMHDFYTDYFAAVEHSHAHAKLCEYAYGKNLAQHGFVTMEQLKALIQVTGMNASSRPIDLGCGNGMIAEYLSDKTGAHITGLDNVASAIALADERTFAKRNRLDFCVGDLNQPDFPHALFDLLLSLDTIYFSDHYAETIQRWRALVRPGGQMAIFYSHGANPQTPKETFRRETLPPTKTPLANALNACGLDFQTWDFTQQDYELAQRKKEILEQLKAKFEAEGNLFLYENRLGETLGVLDAIESGMHARYLYRVRV